MIQDRIENLRQYAGVHPLIMQAADFMARTDLPALPLGRHEIAGATLFVVRDLSTGKGRAGARLEAHRKYIDIQIALDRPDVIGYRAASQCRQVSQH